MSSLKINFQSLYQSHWSATEKINAECISDFVQKLMNDHDFNYIQTKFGNHRYLQHNLSMPDGIEGVLGTVSDVVKRFPEYMYDVKFIMASDNMVLFHSHVTTSKKHRGNDRKGFIITDRWRLVDGEIVEHWDAIQPISGFFRFFTWITGGKIRNPNNLF